MAIQSTRIFGEDGPIARFDSAQWAQTIGTGTMASLGDQASVAVTAALDALPEGVSLLDGRIDLSRAGINVEVAVPVNEPVRDLYGVGSGTKPTSGRFVEFRADLGVKADGKASDLGPWGFSVAGSFDGTVGYRHLLAVPLEDTVTRALLRAVVSSQLPSMVDLRKLAVDEHHIFEATMGLGIEAGIERGFSASIEEPLLEVFDGLPVRLSAQVESVVRATLGLAFHGSMRLVVGRDGGTPDVVRIRLERMHQGTFTFGAMIAVQATYDLASSLGSILDHALGLLPMPQIEKALRDVEALLGKDDNWDNVRKRISAAAAERIAVLLGVEGWLDKVADTEAVRDSFKKVRAAVAAYHELDTKVKSWWDHLLVSSGFDKKQRIRSLLGTLQKIDPNSTTLGDLLDTGNHPELAAAMELIELIAGRSLEDLVAGTGIELRTVLDRVRRFADQAMTFINLDEAVLGRFHQFAKQTGIEGVVEWLETNAVDLATLKKTANTAIEDLLARLIGKSIADIDAADLARVRKWVKGTRTLLNSRAAWEAQLKAKLASLKGTVGFNLAIELGRLAVETAIIDVDVRLGAKKVIRDVEAGLRRMNVDRILAALPAANEEPSAADEPSFLLRECMFLSARERWFKGSLLLGSFMAKTDRRRITEATVAFTPAGGAIERRVSTSGRFVITQESNLATHFSAAAELRIETADSGRGRSEPCLQARNPSLRLSATRSDDKTTEVEVQALLDLVRGFGLKPVGTPLDAVPPNAQTAFGLTLGLPPASLKILETLVANEAKWNLAYLNACHRWFGPGFSADDNAPKGRPLPSQLLPALLRAEYFRANWTGNGPGDLLDWALGKEFLFVFGKKKVSETPYAAGPGSANPRWQPPFLPVGSIVAARSWAFPALRSALKALSEQKTDTPAGMTAACAAFARAVKVAAPWHWRDPLFPVWYVLALVWTIAPETLTGATGLATLRWRRGSTEEWHLATWRSDTGGIALADGTFPFKA